MSSSSVTCVSDNCRPETFLCLLQQLLNVTVEDANARRYFYAVQGNPRQKGELFGTKNMFSLRTGGACFTRDILKVNVSLKNM